MDHACVAWQTPRSRNKECSMYKTDVQEGVSHNDVGMPAGSGAGMDGLAPIERVCVRRGEDTVARLLRRGLKSPQVIY